MKRFSVKKIESQYLVICLIIFLAFISFWFVFPIYSFDSRWYISYLDHFRGVKPMNEWYAVRGFTFPVILWGAYLVQPNSFGIEMVFCCVYIIWAVYVFKIFALVKRECYEEKVSCSENVIIGLVIIFNPVVWGYAHVVLTETIGIFFSTIYIFYAFRFFIKRRKGRDKKKDYVIFLLFSCIMTLILWFLKQSFFANTIFIAAIFEAAVIICKIRLKKIVYAGTLMLAMLLTIKVSNAIWYDVIDVTHNSFTEGLPNRICCLRYFYPEDENISSGHTANISVMDDEYNIIDTFEYTFGENILSRVSYVWECFKKYPGRVVMGYIDNYMLISDVFQNNVSDDIRGKYAYGEVIRSQPIQTIMGAYHLSAEHRNIVKFCIGNEYDSRIGTESEKELLQSINSYSDLMDQYVTVNKPNIVSKLMTNDSLWNITMAGHAILLVGAPFIFIYSLFAYLFDRRKIVMALYCALSGYAFGFVMMYAITGQAIDRHVSTAYAAMLLILAHCIMRLYKCIMIKKMP